ncbi:MAG TPA: hypothetical protein VJS17_10765, partial [Pyrinomonadaceae bacterium]|nr:hypothetical protein [Pyrinomonadaceae bacterium]
PSNDPNAAQIVDGQDDQLGTTAQDIRAAYFKYDPVTNEIVYVLSVTDASVRTPNMRWTLTSAFGDVEVFVTASVDETATTFEYGKITTLATGTQNQETIGAVDFGAIDGSEITMKLGLGKVNAAVGHDVLGTTSTNTQAEAQIMIGSSLSGGLLLNADSGTGSSFDVTPGAPDPTPTPTPTPTPGGNADFKERYSGTINPGQSTVEVPFSLRRSGLDAQINQNHGNQTIYFELLDANGNLIATATDKKIVLSNLAPGNYIYRVRGNVTKPVDFTIKSEQDD